MGDAPPLTGDAVKVTELPEQTGLADEATVTLTGRFGLTVIVTAFDVAGLPVAQGAALDVKIQVITSLFTGTNA